MSFKRRCCNIRYYKNSAITITVTQPYGSYTYTLPAGIYSDIDPVALDAKALSEAKKRAYKYANEFFTLNDITIPECTLNSAISQEDANNLAQEYAEELNEEVTPLLIARIFQGLDYTDTVYNFTEATTNPRVPNNDKWKSLIVEDGWKVTLWQHRNYGGFDHVFTGPISIPDLTVYGFIGGAGVSSWEVTEV